MLQFIFRKIKNQRWLAGVLLIGNILLVSLTALNPLYTQAILQRTMTRRMETYLEENNVSPGQFSIRQSPSLQRNALISGMPDTIASYEQTVGVPVVSRTAVYSLSSGYTTSDMERSDRSKADIAVASISGLSAHAKIIAGSAAGTEVGADGVIDVIVSEATLIKSRLIMGEVLTFDRFRLPDDQPLRVRIAGVFRNREDDALYWAEAPSSFTQTLFMDDTLFLRLFLEESNAYGISATWYTLFDYTQFKAQDAEQIISATNAFKNSVEKTSGLFFDSVYLRLMKDFLSIGKRVSATLLVLKIPIFVLLAAFIFMVSRQILVLEADTVAAMRSRGASRGQVIGVYTAEFSLIALAAFILGIPLGILWVRVLGASGSFLTFVGRASLPVSLTKRSVLFAVAAATASVPVMVLPLIFMTGASIVTHKQNKARPSRPLWQRLFLDVILLGVSLYALYSFRNQKDYLLPRIQEGSSMDPLLYLSSSLFLLGASLVSLRLLYGVVYLIYRLFRDKWSPALYAAFTRILRARGRQNFIVVFLMMTLSLGVFDASAARTIERNFTANLTYACGTDIVLAERWGSNAEEASADPLTDLTYTEPDFGRYETLEGAESVSRVFRTDSALIRTPEDGDIENVQLMAIETDAFGRTARFDTSLLPQHWYHYLNAIAKKADAVLVSRDLRDTWGYDLGDSILYSLGGDERTYGVIYGFVDYWPGYTDRSHPLIIANLSQTQAIFGILPYEVWIRAKGSNGFIYDFAENNPMRITAFTDLSNLLEERLSDPVILGTFGSLTVGFIVVLVLCGFGFLIYWILSIRERQLMFGIFRAMGMSMREIGTLLFGEHIFLSVLPILFGIVIGRLCARLYMPLIQIAYTEGETLVPLRVVTEAGDLARLIILVGLIILVCILILRFLIRKMKITEALKLGED